MTQKTLVERIAQFVGIKEVNFTEQLRQAESELLRIRRELDERIIELNNRIIEQLRGGGSYDLTDGLMSATEIKSKIQRYFPSAETSYEVPETRNYTMGDR